MQNNPSYQNVVIDVFAALEQFCNQATQLESKSLYSTLVLDLEKPSPQLSAFKPIKKFHSLGYPLLVGVSESR